MEESADPSKIEPPLREYLERSAPEEMISIVLILERQVTEEEKGQLFSQVATQDRLQEKQQKRQLLIQQLKQVARAEQSAILELLNIWKAEGQVMHVQPLWLVDAIGLEARRPAIEHLATIQGIQSIHLDLPRPAHGAVEWGVAKIKADQVWTMRPRGYNGSGVTVAVLDSGVSYTHDDLRGRMWINSAEDNGDNQFTSADNDGKDNDGNGFVDDVVGWNFCLPSMDCQPGNDPAPDGDSHGTHVAGIVAGDGTRGTQTGVAPGARIMALRESGGIGGIQDSTEKECWAGMQYALDNGADIINFSVGFKPTWCPAFATWRRNVKNLMDGGVLFVTIAHNDNNRLGAPYNIRTPGTVPLALTVGATGKTDLIWQNDRGEGSNHGPVTWQHVSRFRDYPWPPGLRKPDVTAPGVDVISTVLGGRYLTGKGTSQAAPHVAGLAALLLDKDPSLTPYELKLIIEETSIALSAEPNNVFGWGRIDASKAINYRISPLPHDLATDRDGRDIWVDNDDDSKPDKLVVGTNHLYARIHNLGGRVVSDAQVQFYSFGTGSGGCPSGPRRLLGTYAVPILGPKSSRHGTALAVIHWEVKTGDSRCIGVEITAPPPNHHEPNLSNNKGFREL